VVFFVDYESYLCPSRGDHLDRMNWAVLSEKLGEIFLRSFIRNPFDNKGSVVPFDLLVLHPGFHSHLFFFCKPEERSNSTA